MKSKQNVIWFAAAAATLLFAGCAPNHEMFLEKSAGSGPACAWPDRHHHLCHQSVHTDKVAVYEVNNSGSWYDFGFILGILISVGHGKVQHSMQKKWTCKAKKRKRMGRNRQAGRRKSAASASRIGSTIPKTRIKSGKRSAKRSKKESNGNCAIGRKDHNTR
jgi:hypothetical protein